MMTKYSIVYGDVIIIFSKRSVRCVYISDMCVSHNYDCLSATVNCV